MNCSWGELHSYPIRWWREVAAYLEVKAGIQADQEIKRAKEAERAKKQRERDPTTASVPGSRRRPGVSYPRRARTG